MAIACRQRINNPARSGLDRDISATLMIEIVSCPPWESGVRIDFHASGRDGPSAGPGEIVSPLKHCNRSSLLIICLQRSNSGVALPSLDRTGE